MRDRFFECFYRLLYLSLWCCISSRQTSVDLSFLLKSILSLIGQLDVIFRGPELIVNGFRNVFSRFTDYCH